MKHLLLFLFLLSLPVLHKIAQGDFRRTDEVVSPPRIDTVWVDSAVITKQQMHRWANGEYIEVTDRNGMIHLIERP